jgi:hypothetical protein
MSDGRKNNGGRRPGAGRKPKPVEDAQHSVLLTLFDADAERRVVLNLIELASTPNPAAVSAAKELFDRKYGIVKDTVETSGDVLIRVRYENS